MTPESREIDAGGHRLHVDISGTGPPDLVCLHGLVDSVAIWDRVTPPLAKTGRVVRVDQRGHGRSEAPPGPYRREDLASDVTAVLASLAIERAVLVGHSLGGIISMTTALCHPEQVAGLVLVATASQCNAKVAGWYERIAAAGERDGNAGLAHAIYGEKTRKQVAGDAQGIAHVTRALKSLFEDPLTPKLSAIRCPVLLVVGEKDPMGPKASAIIAENLPDARLEIVPDCGHWIHVERPQVLLDAIERFVPRIQGGPTGA
ncbi:MAG: alpha/beta fold hydrolase [Myxococcota bacterium]|jgi:3-oxoadipate enol-lactonase|nr:hypothetical protein [Deltaproteobacteria bacterium]MCP4242030.1 alpha/beta fold hydrolase [bacterium]MDP6075350.1 alpha/beta fold hydrolase [Myxococcota bacterium]MDP6243018.1 alpha/beta fold hydrolase [Myxococcota bacterium]MDP7073974.1 alpha/beta fold hydrolase [Myxococcota bacterium]